MMSGLGISKKQRRDFFRSVNYTCAHCGIVGREIRCSGNTYVFHTDTKGVYLSADHIIPRSKGGSSDLSNIQCLCTRCNSKKGTR